MVEEFVSFTSEGMRIAGMMHIPEATPAPGIVFCHGFTGTRVESHRLFVLAAREFCNQGFVVLRFDFRGSGESEGLLEHTTISGEMEDLKAAVSWIHKRKETLNQAIGVNGLSLGGAVAALTAAEDLTINTVSLWSTPATLSPESLKETMNEVLREPEAAVDRLMKEGYLDLSSGDRISKEFVMSLFEHDISEAVSRIAPRPLLIVHGMKDPTVPAWHAQKLYEKAGEPKEKFLVEGADHTFARSDWQTKVIEYTANWFKKHMP